jgi:hypothetical protein
MPVSALELKTILDEKDGIFENTEADMPRFIELEENFNSELRKIRGFSSSNVIGTDIPPQGIINKIKDISFDIDPISINQLKLNIEGLKANITLSHLGVFYGLTPNTNNLILIMQGVGLDGSDDGAKLHERPTQVASTQFSTSNLLARPNSNSAARNHFKETFKFVHGRDNFIFGAYIKFQPFLDKLSQLEAEGCNRLKITFGFLAPIGGSSNPLDLNCFHLIFKGLKPDNLTPSAKIFSTFDNLPGYSGPKPSCPPFGDT